MNAINDVLNAWMKTLAGRYSPHTLKAYEHDVSSFLTFLSAHLGGVISLQALNNLGVAEVRSWLSSRKMDYQARSTVRAFSALKMFFVYLVRHQHIERSVFDMMRPPKMPTSLPKALSVEQAFHIIHHIDELSDHTWVGKRDQALFMLLYSVGLRISEALSLNQDALKANQLRVIGKGNKERFVPFLPQVREYLSHYLTLCPFPKGDQYPLFYGFRGGRLAARIAQRQIQRYRELTQLPDTATPHAMRHSCATHLIENSDDIRAVQELLGHSSLSTTQIYTQIDQKKLMDSYYKAHPQAKK
ncbi:MAG: tyrosine recombinase XerC [Alphaproteobacteria bacterium]|nr:tyrosine recombinase XerC [Alphaproteobacteria bacterium]